MSRFLLSGFAALVVAFTLLSCSSEPEHTLIGLAGPLTGFNAVYGEQTRRGAEMAVADINAAGGVLGRPLRLKLGDDQCDPKQAVAVANDMVRARVPFVMGHFCSGSAIPAADVYAEAGIIAMSSAATNPRLTEDPAKKNIFRICGRDDQQGVVAGAFLARRFGAQKIAIVHDRTSYAEGLAGEVRKALQAAGAREALFDTITPGEKDYAAFVSKLKQAGIEVLYFGGYPAEAILLVRQMREQGVQAVFVSGDGLANTEFWTSTGPGAEGALFTFGPDVAADPANAAVVERFRAKGQSAEGYTLYAYAAIQAWAQAAVRAGTTEPGAVQAALRAGELSTVMGPVGFDAKGDVKAPGYVIYRWSNGKFAPLHE